MWPFLLFNYLYYFPITTYYIVKNEENEKQMKYSEALKKNKDFQYVYKNGKSYANRYLVMYVLKNDMEKNRIGISVSKKVGNSVVRHHLTRLIRESYRILEANFQVGYDIVVIARVSSKDKGYHDIKSALDHLGKLHDIYN